MKPILSIGLLLCALVAAQEMKGQKRSVVEDRPAIAPMLHVEEELVYYVYYSFLRIGSLRFRVESKDELNGRPVYRAACIIESAPGLRWLVDLHVTFRSLMDSLVYAYAWTGTDSTSESLNISTLAFDYDLDRVYYSERVEPYNGSPVIQAQDTAATMGECYDGLSIFYFARLFATTTWQTSVLTYVDTSGGPTSITFTGRKEEAEVDAIDYPVETIYMNGEAGFVGVFGITGGFEGWFSNDEARIPIVAKLKVLLGSIRMELVEWKREGWVPPRFQE